MSNSLLPQQSSATLPLLTIDQSCVESQSNGGDACIHRVADHLVDSPTDFQARIGLRDIGQLPQFALASEALTDPEYGSPCESLCEDLHRQPLAWINGSVSRRSGRELRALASLQPGSLSQQALTAAQRDAALLQLGVCRSQRGVTWTIGASDEVLHFAPSRVVSISRGAGFSRPIEFV